MILDWNLYTLDIMLWGFGFYLRLYFFWICCALLCKERVEGAASSLSGSDRIPGCCWHIWKWGLLITSGLGGSSGSPVSLHDASLAWCPVSTPYMAPTDTILGLTLWLDYDENPNCSLGFFRHSSSGEGEECLIAVGCG